MLGEIRKELVKEDRIILAVVYGGFLRSEVFRDVDLAVFTGYSVSPSEEVEFCETLSRRLERAVGLPLDVRLLDYAPPGFRLSVLREGKVLLERRACLSVDLRAAASREIADIRAKRAMIRSKLGREPRRVRSSGSDGA